MLVMTAKVDKKKILIAIGALILAIGTLMGLIGDHTTEEAPAAATTVANVTSNDDRVKFLENFGWDVTASPVESMQVHIPSQSSEVYQRYNDLQKSQGYDLTKFAGKTVMRYVYLINNYPDATEPVYATVLVYRDQIIGGDVTSSGPGGQVRGFSMPEHNSD